MRIISSMKLNDKSRTVVYVDSAFQSQRVRVPRGSLENLESDDDNIFAVTIHDRYASRPDTLQYLTLAQFATQYSLLNNGASTNEGNQEKNNEQTGKRFTLKNGHGAVRRRKKDAVLRFHKYSEEKMLPLWMPAARSFP